MSSPKRHPRVATLLAAFLACVLGVFAWGTLTLHASSPASRATTQAPVSVFPEPGSIAASPQSTIAFRGIDPGDIGTIGVDGSVSGAHRGS